MTAPLATVSQPIGTVERTAGTVLFLVADTGGGHRAAAAALIEAIGRRYAGRLVAVECDPLGGPSAPAVLRWITRLYGPLIRWAPWLWGALFHVSNSRAAMRLLRSTLLGLAVGPVGAAFARHRPVAVVSCHPLTGAAAVRSRTAFASCAPIVTVVTDLVTLHRAWRNDPVDRLVHAAGNDSGTGAGRSPRRRPAGGRRVCRWPADGAERARLRGQYGLDRAPIRRPADRRWRGRRRPGAAGDRTAAVLSRRRHRGPVWT